MNGMAADRKHQLIFYLALPLAIGLVMGGPRAGMARLLPQELALLYWVGSMLLVWASFDIGSRVAALALKPWKPPLLVILLLGAVLARIATEPMSRFWVEGFIGRIDPEALKALTQAGAASVQPWAQRILRPYYLVAIWVAANYYYLILLRLPRYGVAPREQVPVTLAEPPAESPADLPAEDSPMMAPSAVAVAPGSDPLPAFVSQFCPQVGLSLIALEAEDHYVRVHGELKSALISYRFADALRDVAALDGLQVHRSFWVSRAAIREIRRAGRSVSLEMANGLSIPVSHAYKELARRAMGVPGTAPASAHSRIH